MRLSRARIREFLGTGLGVTLATGTLNQCVHEAAHAVRPVEEERVDEVNRSALLHGDETAWKEARQALWLWVFTSTTVTFYLIGYRTREFLDRLLGEAFTGWLMTDGYRLPRLHEAVALWGAPGAKSPGALQKAWSHPPSVSANIPSTCCRA